MYGYGSNYDFGSIYDRDRHDGAPDYVELRHDMPRARKRHKCREPHREHFIEIGEQYDRTVFVEDGVFHSEATCMDCLREAHE